MRPIPVLVALITQALQAAVVQDMAIGDGFENRVAEILADERARMRAAIARELAGDQPTPRTWPHAADRKSVV